MIVFLFLFLFNSQILKTGNSFHRQFTKQILWTAVKSDLFAVWCPGLCSKCHLFHGSFSSNPPDTQKAHIQLKPTAALQKLNKLTEKTHSLRLRIKKTGGKLSYGLVRGYRPIITYQQVIELVQQTSQFSRKHCLYLLDPSLLTQKKKQNQCGQLRLQIFLYSNVFR